MDMSHIKLEGVICTITYKQSKHFTLTRTRPLGWAQKDKTRFV